MLEIITPAESRDLTTLEVVKAECGITDTASDTRIERLITQASVAIGSWCCRAFAGEEVRETLQDQPSRCPHRVLSRHPIISITSITIDGTTIDPSGYQVNTALGLIYRRINSKAALWERGETVVTYTAGYVLPPDDERDLPEDVEAACIMMVRTALATSSPDDTRIRSKTVEGVGGRTYFETSADAVPPAAQALLEPYRERGV